jgi:hypothetical protein
MADDDATANVNPVASASAGALFFAHTELKALSGVAPVTHNPSSRPSAGKAPLLSTGSPAMGYLRTIYRGYAIHLSGEPLSWSFRAEPIMPDLPIFGRPASDGHASWGKALRKAKRHIDLLLADTSE